MGHSKLKRVLGTLAVSAMLASPMAVSANEVSEEEMKQRVAQGKELAWNRAQGNCLACHMMPEGTSPGNIGPALIAMQLRYPDRQKLFDKLWGVKETEVKYSMMPLFGRHGILSDEEINLIVDYLYTL
ncbi:sulfur oxidation c-type cytochrome SoxX [Thiomicrospira cyclica]|uniref:Cytochrome c, class I n=1 Tax=Thiomicrospira cyclica (strain DSM 14477 / JCM 11371 / ALM1) TaxID=717773 RepID=F6D9V8_THICA|nr:sulfur oxidation c-type cytochrome SoxX [Thiomicrospira cyclica]AEG30995.1 cytochrome c, class I [Thiomicrospira cyclica ALM1]